MKLTTIALTTAAAGIIAGATATELHNRHTENGTAVVVVPYCATEDGSDYPGRHCLWVDPATGRGYVNNNGHLTAGGVDTAP